MEFLMSMWESLERRSLEEGGWLALKGVSTFKGCVCNLWLCLCDVAMEGRWVLEDVVECRRMLLSVGGCCWVLEDVVECWKMLLSVVGCWWMVLKVVKCWVEVLDVVRFQRRLWSVISCNGILGKPKERNTRHCSVVMRDVKHYT